MGYCIDQKDSRFHIDCHKKQEALAALQATLVRYAQEGIYFGFTDTRAAIQAPTLEAALQHCRYLTKTNEQGDITRLTFVGEKLGNDFELFKLLAPYCRPGSYLEFTGEDSDLWRWVLDGKTVHEIRPQISWPSLIEGDMVEGVCTEIANESTPKQIY